MLFCCHHANCLMLLSAAWYLVHIEASNDQIAVLCKQSAVFTGWTGRRLKIFRPRNMGFRAEAHPLCVGFNRLYSWRKLKMDVRDVRKVWRIWKSEVHQLCCNGAAEAWWATNHSPGKKKCYLPALLVCQSHFWGLSFITSLNKKNKRKYCMVNKNLWPGCAAEPTKEE